MSIRRSRPTQQANIHLPGSYADRPGTLPDDFTVVSDPADDGLTIVSQDMPMPPLLRTVVDAVGKRRAAKQPVRPKRAGESGRRDFLTSTLGLTGLAAGGLAGNMLAANQTSAVKHELSVQAESNVQDRIAVAKNNLIILDSLSQAAEVEMPHMWDDARELEAANITRQIEHDPALRNNTAAAFAFACEAFQKYNTFVTPADGKTRLSEADLFYALGAANNPRNITENDTDMYESLELNAIQAHVTNLATNLASNPETALRKLSIISAVTIDFANDRGLDPDYIASLDKGSQSSICINAYSSVGMALYNSTRILDVPFEQSK